MSASQNIPELLRTLRRNASMTQAQLADASRVSRRTLIRWEAGTVSPWIPELKAVLKVLDVDEAQAKLILAELGTPRGSREISAVPSSALGKILRAMRLRRALTMSELAASLGCDTSTVDRWETGRLKPGDDVLGRLWPLLNAHLLEQEAIAALPHRETNLDNASAEEELEGILWPWDPWGCVLLDVRFLSLIDRLDQAQFARQPLAEALCSYAEALLAQGRHVEAEAHAGRVIEMDGPSDISPNAHHAAALAQARSRIRSGKTAHARRGLQTLDWLERRPLNLEHYSLRLICYAEYHVGAGDLEAATRMASQAVESVRRRRPEIARLRGFDRARILLECGLPEEALERLPPVGDRSPADIASESLVWSQALGAVGRSEDACHWRLIAERQIEEYSLHRRFMRPSDTFSQTEPAQLAPP